MLKLTKKRCINKRTASKALASIRRKRMISRRKRQIGGVITLPKEITFRVYQSSKDFPTIKECDATQQPEKCKVLLMCPEKWHEDTQFTPNYLYVEATKKQEFGFMSNTVDYSNKNLLDTLQDEYEFNVNYTNSTLKYNEMYNTLPEDSDSFKILITTSHVKISLADLRKMITDFYYRQGHNFSQYIGEYGETSKTIIAWCDVYSDDRKVLCSFAGRHAEKTIPACTEYTINWVNSRSGTSC